MSTKVKVTTGKIKFVQVVNEKDKTVLSFRIGIDGEKTVIIQKKLKL